MNIKVQLDVSPEDVGCRDYSGYVITAINTNDDVKEIWSVSYDYTWDCGDGCCSDTEHDIAYVGQMAEWLKQWVLEKMPGYHLQGIRWGNSGSMA